MSGVEAVSTQVALVDAALRLVDERRDVPAGSVLRCFSRAVLITRRARVSSEALPEQAEVLARRFLEARDVPRQDPRPLAEALLTLGLVQA